MKFLNNLSIRNKLILLLVLPLSVLLYFLQKTVAGELDRRHAIITIRRDVEVVEQISSVIHEFQKEGNLAQISNSNQQSYRSEIIRQQEKTDKAIYDLQTIYVRNKIITRGLDTLTSLARFRKTLHTFPLIAHRVNLNFLEEISKYWKSTQLNNTKNQLESLLFLLYAKEFLTQLKNLSPAVLSKNMNEREYGKFSSTKGKYEISLYTFKKNASQELLNHFKVNFEHTPSVIHMNKVIDDFFQYGGGPSFSIDPETWSTDLSIAINTLNKIEDYAFEKTHEGITLEARNVQQNLVKKVAFAGTVIIVIITIAVLMIKAIVKSVTEMRDATERIMKGDIDFALNVTSNDEMGHLAASFNKMISVFQDYIQIAHLIGKGDYETDIKLRSDKDFLGKALRSMRDNLHNLSKEKETKTWLLSGNNALNDRFREEKEVRNLAQDVITQIAVYLNAQVGAIYLLENGMLNRVGGYALDIKTMPQSFAVGQSLVGQAAQERKPILFEEVPQDYIKITSGLGNASPTNIIVFPFIYIGKVKGVIELGATKRFTNLDFEFLQLVGNNIAIAFNSSQSRFKLKELLEETQRQAEELESQQEELRQFNDELLEKLNAIEKSEASLKVEQEELQQSNAALEYSANLLANEKRNLEKAKREVEIKAQNLESVSRYKSEFLANMSHELRTPLNSILILTQLLIENKNGTLNEKEIKYANVIYNSGNELLTLINDILDLAKVESGKMELAMEEIPIGEIISDMSMMFSQVAKNKSIEFKMDVSNVKGKTIFTDKQRLEQILRNLMSNAFKFTPAKGTVTLAIQQLSDKELKFQKKTLASDVIAFSVIDTGIGIQKEKQEIIFEAFRQVDSTDKRKYGGTGLGLSISRELSDLLGGEIGLRSEEGKGSTFTLYLPVKNNSTDDLTFKSLPFQERKLRVQESPLPSETGEEVANDDRYTVTENSRVILIMEDDQEFAQIILDFVRERNYKGIIANQGNTGLSYARHFKPDAILLDMRLPVLDGEEVIRQLKHDPDLRHIPVQIISGYSLKKEVMKLGAFDFIRKPVSKEDLQKIFDRLEDFASRKYKRLLIVETNPKENKAMCELIGNGDVECLPALSFEEAYQKLEQSSFDCIVVAIGSNSEAFEFLEKIKSNNQKNKIPIIVYSTHDVTREQTKKLNALANTVVLKTAYSQERLLDETTLFLHRVEATMPKEKQNIIRRLHRADKVLQDKTVLIVDDDMRNIYSLTNLLEEEGMHCLTAANGKEALELLDKKASVDIILMDVMMPEMDGYEATSEIRKSGNFSKIPIVALTAKAMKGDREKCLAVGMSDYITKPVDVNQLLSLMRVWLYK